MMRDVVEECMGVYYMNNQELQKLTEKISLTHFQKPFRHKALFNPRLRSTGGRYLLHNHNIEINYKYFEEHGMDELIGIVKHELCHYHLHIEGRGYKHRDPEFKKLMQEVGAPRYCTPLVSRRSTSKKHRMYHYKCKDCGMIYIRKRRVNTIKYVCGRCRGKLVLDSVEK